MTSSPSLIFALSEDIVVYIFSFCGPSALAEDLAREHGEVVWMKNRGRCLAITHVCRLWREYALRCPSLWTAPMLDRPKLARLMMDRTETAPLTIVYPTSPPKAEDEDSDVGAAETPDVLEEALEQSYRVYELALAAESHDLHRYLSLLPSPTS
jgi:hypothetical protein